MRFTRSNPIGLRLTIVGGVLHGRSYPVTIKAGAFTWGYTIDFLAERFDPTDGIDVGEVVLATHEFTHSEQFSKDRRFSLKYIAKWVDQVGTHALFTSAAKIWEKGLGDLAYRSIDYEKEAVRFEEKVKADLRRNGNPCNPKSENGKKYGK